MHDSGPGEREMKLLILSRKKRLYSTRRLREEGEKLGHEVFILDPLKCVLSLKEDGPRMLYGPKEIKNIDLEPTQTRSRTASPKNSSRSFDKTPVCSWA